MDLITLSMIKLMGECETGDHMKNIMGFPKKERYPSNQKNKNKNKK